jgi:hypothetical protein
MISGKKYRQEFLPFSRFCLSGEQVMDNGKPDASKRR